MILTNTLVSVLPQVKRRLGQYRRYLQEKQGPLVQQGLNSIRDKEFHCLGGAVYSLLAPKKYRGVVLTFIVAFQTISDYLDNLCDRFGVKEERAFRQLHIAMLDCLARDEQAGDYYRYFPHKDDGGYLSMLVDQCRNALAAIPYYTQNVKWMYAYTGRYIDLQSYKHMEQAPGAAKLAACYQAVAPRYPGLKWWEYAAASGSTLGIFALAADAGRPARVWDLYMPWLNGLHILLDYFIDQAEDREHGDMNLVSFYEDYRQVERILWFYWQARSKAVSLPKAGFHTLVTDGLLALYLTDPKATEPERAEASQEILSLAARRVGRLAALARWLRRRGTV